MSCRASLHRRSQSSSNLREAFRTSGISSLEIFCLKADRQRPLVVKAIHYTKYIKEDNSLPTVPKMYLNIKKFIDIL